MSVVTETATDKCDSCDQVQPPLGLAPVMFPDATFLVCSGCLPR